VERIGYAERRPYVVPRVMSDLTGPTHGIVTLPAGLGWTGRTSYNVDDEADRAVLYERLLVEATTLADVTRRIDETMLRALWRRLFIPHVVRRLWEQRFTDLAPAA
jgi:hypothetical protein